MDSDGKLRTIIGGLAFVATALAGGNAHADASLTLVPASTHCGAYISTFDPLTGSEVTRREASSCAPSPSNSFQLAYFPGTSGVAYTFIEATFAFTYQDDGLALPSPVTLDTADYVTRGTSGPNAPPAVSFESATLAVDMATAFGSFNGSISATASGAPADGTSTVDGLLFFGLNDHADSFSGTLSLVIRSSEPAFVTGISVAPSVAAIPEPSTYALSLVGLAAVAAAARRRRACVDAEQSRSTG